MFVARNIYFKQHFWLKIITLIVGIIDVIVLSIFHQILIFLGLILFFCFYPKFYIIWINTFLKMYLFWLSFFILGIIFQISFIEQLYVFFKIFLLMGFSIYIVASIKKEELEYVHRESFSKVNFFERYLTITFYLIPFFIEQYKVEYKKNKSPVEIISNAFRSSSEKIFNLTQSPSLSNSNETFYTFSNLYLSFFLLYLVLISAI